MLSREAWRLLQNPDSLCAQVLCAKYYLDGNVLHAQVNPGISYAWHSILHGVELIKQGVIWRIGDGNNVKIWEDPWVPKLWSRKISTPRNGNLLTYVNELINPIMGQWDEQLVRDTFNEEDTSMILGMPLREGAVDFYAWHFDSKGVHLVKKAYKLHRDLLVRDGQRGGQSSASIPSSLGGQWRSILAAHLENAYGQQTPCVYLETGAQFSRAAIERLETWNEAGGDKVHSLCKRRGGR
jgi:hypothetical protein